MLCVFSFLAPEMPSTDIAAQVKSVKTTTDQAETSTTASEMTTTHKASEITTTDAPEITITDAPEITTADAPDMTTTDGKFGITITITTVHFFFYLIHVSCFFAFITNDNT
ncbi:uncharacterized protein LOC110040310 [Orbicella faveolata]|uniref:uncharacterized protein LOC110040310 n=1 Tax=Orbicella faveolata TaxID=48498 RepID=UPI0009E64055|nr:uncharacterized protein LOC110040310 [Orbicella faveolata]